MKKFLLAFLLIALASVLLFKGLRRIEEAGSIVKTDKPTASKKTSPKDEAASKTYASVSSRPVKSNHDNGEPADYTEEREGESTALAEDESPQAVFISEEKIQKKRQRAFHGRR